MNDKPEKFDLTKLSQLLTETIKKLEVIKLKADVNLMPQPTERKIQPGDVVVDYGITTNDFERLVVHISKNEEGFDEAITIRLEGQNPGMIIMRIVEDIRFVRRLDAPEIDHLKRLYDIRTLGDL